MAGRGRHGLPSTAGTPLGFCPSEEQNFTCYVQKTLSFVHAKKTSNLALKINSLMGFCVRGDEEKHHPGAGFCKCSKTKVSLANESLAVGTPQWSFR